MAMRLAVTYTLYATSSKKQTGDVITFTQFEEGNILTKTCNKAESGDESDKKSIMMSEQDIDAINSSDESDHDIISTEMLEDICDESQTHPNVSTRAYVSIYVTTLFRSNGNAPGSDIYTVCDIFEKTNRRCNYVHTV